MRLAPLALVVLAACSSGTDIDVDASAPTTARPAAAVDVYLLPEGATDCGVVDAVEQRAGEATVAGALEVLLRGDGIDGYGSMFTPGTAGSLRGVTVQEGVAYVDFDDFSQVIPNASASCGGTALLAQLDGTAEAFDGVDDAVYSFEGSRTAFYDWLQLDVPHLGSGS